MANIMRDIFEGEVNIMEDKQQNRVYKWERTYVAPHDLTPVPFDNIQTIVNYVWEKEGLRFPPRVEPLPIRIKKWLGDADRTTIRFQVRPIHTWVILHEMSHSMSSTVEDISNQHGAIFMGLFIQLLSRYLRLDAKELIRTAEASKLRVMPDARPVFI